MSDQPQSQAEQGEPLDLERIQRNSAMVMQTIAGAVSQSLNALNQRNDAANTALMAFAVILAAMPETAALRAERVAGVLGALVKNNEKEQRDVANFITGLVNMSREVPKALAAVEATYRADQAKAGNGAAKPN